MSLLNLIYFVFHINSPPLYLTSIFSSTSILLLNSPYTQLRLHTQLQLPTQLRFSSQIRLFSPLHLSTYFLHRLFNSIFNSTSLLNSVSHPSSASPLTSVSLLNSAFQLHSNCQLYICIRTLFPQNTLLTPV